MMFILSFTNINCGIWLANAILLATCTGLKSQKFILYFPEYAAIIKEKNKNLERFEASLQSQEEGNNILLPL